MKKRIVSYLLRFLAALLMISTFKTGFINVSAWTGPNTNNFYETLGGFYYYFTMYIKPSYNDGGYHYARGWWHVSGGASGNRYFYTPAGTSASDSRLLGYTDQVYQDWWDFDHPNDPVNTNGGPQAAKIPHGASYWLNTEVTE